MVVSIFMMIFPTLRVDCFGASFYDDRRALRQADHTGNHSRVTVFFAEKLGHQIGSSISHDGVIRELRCRYHVNVHLHEVLDPVQVAHVFLHAQRGHSSPPIARPGGLLDGELVAQPPGDGEFAVGPGKRPADEEQRADLGNFHLIAQRFGHPGEFQTERTQMLGRPGPGGWISAGEE
jgi:hypothetical protein